MLRIFRQRFKLFILYVTLSHLGLSYADLAPCKQQLGAQLCAKIGQMLIVGFGGLNQDPNGQIIWQDKDSLVFNRHSNIAKEIKDDHIGGVVLYSRVLRNKVNGQFIRDRNIQNSTQLAKLTTDLQNYATETKLHDGSRDLPLLISIDQEGGMVDRLPSEFGFKTKNSIPQAFGLNEELVFANPERKKQALQKTRQYANQVADELAAMHFNVNFAPCVDVNINPLSSIIGSQGRSFSANPDVVFDQAWQFVQAFHAKGIAATLKHFPGHGSSAGDTHEGLVDVTDSYQMNKELLPYRLFINKGYQDLIMTTHVINGQIDRSQCKSGSAKDHHTFCPGTMSYASLTKLLRQTLHFKGVIVSDDMTMGAISDEYSLEEALQKAINAGVDMILVSNHYGDNTETVINTIAKLVKEGLQWHTVQDLQFW